MNSVLNASNVFFSMRMVYRHSYCYFVNESAAHSVNFIAITVIKREDPQMLAIDVRLHSSIASELNACYCGAETGVQLVSCLSQG